MKLCPTCGRTYDDVGLKFCLDDGTELVLKTPESAAEPTAVLSGTENTPETIEAPTPVVASPESEVPLTVAAPAAVSRSIVPVVITVAVLLMIGAVILALEIFVPSGDGILRYFLTRVARRLPMLLLALGGIAFAIIRWRLHPRASLMTVVALAIYLVDMVIYTMLLYWLPSLIEPMRMSPSGSRWFYSVVYFIEDIVFAVTIILLVAAAFADRKTRTSS